MLAILALTTSFVFFAPAPQSDGDSGALDAAIGRIVERGLASDHAFTWLTELCDDIGPRLSGSAQAEQAVEWGRARLEEAGADRVVLHPVNVARWVRGEVERARILEPADHRLAVLALGGSIATPPGGITAPVIVVKTFEELRSRASEARGKIVLFNRAMGETADDGSRKLGYGDAVQQRTNGAIEAAKVGAVASVIRSVGTKGAEYRLPHTGMMRYEDGVKRIPHAALAAEDADLIARLVARHPRVMLNLELDCRDEGTVQSHNVIADLRGRERPDEVVLICGHLDSWDVGHGAHDDGVGVVASMEVIRLLKSLDLRPRRTIRCVLFMNEENGLAGGLGYAKDYARELAGHVAAIEMDGGAFGFSGFGVSAGEGGVAMVDDVARRIRSVPGYESLRVRPGGGGADIGPLSRAGNVPMLSIDSDSETYFRYHHTHADTLDKVDPRELARHAAAYAALVYALAEMERPLPRLAAR
jgi:carboxypeptidase Q